MIQTTHCTLLSMIIPMRISSTSHVPLHVHQPLHGQTLALLPLAKLVHDYQLLLIQRIIHTYPIKIIQLDQHPRPLNTPLALHRVYLTQPFGLTVLLTVPPPWPMVHRLQSIITTIAYISSMQPYLVAMFTTSAQTLLHIP